MTGKILRFTSLLFIGFSVAFIGCGEKLDPFLSGPGIGSGQVVTYSIQIKPILDQNCILCHGSTRMGAERNGAPLSVNLDTYEEAVAAAERANARIQAGTMPPAGGGIPSGDRVLFQDWVAQGLLH